jgi:hypothetical protein
VQLLEWTTIGPAPSFGLIVPLTDADREFAYDIHPKSSVPATAFELLSGVVVLTADFKF